MIAIAKYECHSCGSTATITHDTTETGGAEPDFPEDVPCGNHWCDDRRRKLND